MGIGVVDGQAFFDDGDFAFQGGIVNAGAAPGQLCHRLAAQDRNNGGGRRGVGDSHITGSDQLISLYGVGLLDQFRAEEQTRDRLFTTHRRPVSKGSGPFADFSMQDRPILGKIRRHAAIDYPHISPDVAGQHVDGGPPLDKAVRPFAG